MKKISIITINYNNAVGLNKTIQSVINQTYKNIEYIIIDGLSIDDSIIVIKKYLSYITYWVTEKDEGVFYAQNKGIKNATGDYILVLNSGDELENTKVVETIFNTNITQDIIYGNMVVIDHNNCKTYAKMPQNITFKHMMFDTIWHPVSFIKKDFFQKVGLYNTNYTIVADYHWFLNAIFNNNATLKYFDLPISNFYLGGLSSLPINAEKLKQERLIAQLNIFGNTKVDAYYKKTNKLTLKNIIKKIIKKFS